MCSRPGKVSRNLTRVVPVFVGSSVAGVLPVRHDAWGQGIGEKCRVAAAAATLCPCAAGILCTRGEACMLIRPALSGALARVLVAQRAQHHCPLSVIAGIQPGTLAPAALLPALDWVQGHLPPALDRLAVTNPVHAVELRGSHGGATAGKVLCRHLRKLGEVHSRHGHAHVSKPSHARHLRAGQYQNSWASINVAFGTVVLGNARAVGRSGAGACKHRLTHSHPQHACTRPRLTLNIMSGTPNSSRAGLAGVSPRSSANNIHRLRRAGGGRKHSKTTVSQLQAHGTRVSRAISRASKLEAKQSQAYRGHRSSRNFWTGGMRRRMLSLVLAAKKEK